MLLSANIVLKNFRYNEIFFIIDTCQASSMYEKFYSPNILATASSLVGEDSLSVSNIAILHFQCNTLLAHIDIITAWNYIHFTTSLLDDFISIITKQKAKDLKVLSHKEYSSVI